MSAEQITEAMEQFLREHISSLPELELLLLLEKRTRPDWSAAEVAAELRIDPQWTERKLDELHARGLVTCQSGPPERYRFNPGASEQAAIVSQLAQCYERRRVSIITLIYSKPKDHLRNFADAFRLRERK